MQKLMKRCVLSVAALAALSALAETRVVPPNDARTVRADASERIQPQWISDTDGTQWTGIATNQPPLPKNTIRMRRTFALADRPVRQAVAELCGYGFAEVWVNGAPADPRRRLSPAVCNYAQRALSATYDVTALLRPGDENTLGLWISPGYSDDFSRWGWRWLLAKRAWGRLDIDYCDGTRQTVVTDGAWEWTDYTPIGEVSVYDGERYEAAREDPDWCRPCGSVAVWKPVRIVTPCTRPSDGRDIVPEKNPAPFIRTLETFKPVSIRETAPGVWLVDFGQNAAGVCELRAKGRAGTCITLRHSETIRRDGSGKLDPFPQRKAKATDRFVLAGTGAWERYIPHFTYHGFRYVEVDGYPGRLTADDIRARAIHADVAYTAGFKSSDATLTWLFDAAKWTLLSNLLNYPSDCCDRDERTPCRGDSKRSEPTAMRFFDMRGFYAKWLDDIRFDGPAVPATTGDLVTLPWRFWELYGDRSQMEKHYGDMKRVALGFIEKYNGYIVEKFGYGDWCHPNNKTWEGYFCEPRALCSAIIYKLLTTMRDVAELTGRTEDVPLWEEHAAKSRAAYLEKIYNPKTHVFSSGIQATYLLPLAVGLVPEQDHAAVVSNLVAQIRRDGLKLTTGGLATHYLVNVLCNEGHADLAYHLLTQPEYPSPAYMRAQGATTLWEQWYYEEAMNSHAHMMFTGLGWTLLTDFAGIRAKKPGYAELEIRPACPAKLSFVEAWQMTPHGRVDVVWRRSSGGIDFTVTVPKGVPATLVLPDGTSRALNSGSNRIHYAVRASPINAAAGAAPLRVSGIFSDHMVLQRGKPHPVWGTASAGARVTVAFAGQRVEAVADRDGAWQATLAPLALAKTPQTMSVACGAETVSFSDLLVGDVWLITGQSNAEMRMGDVLDKEREMATSKDFPQIRSTKFAHRRAVFPAKDPCNGPWFVCDEKTLPKVTAMGWFFAREIVRETGVPIGILDNNWGGCAIEPYISREGFASVPALKNLSDQCEKQLKDLGVRGEVRGRYKEAIGELEQWRQYANERQRLGLPIESYPYRVPGATQLAGQHNAMIAPIARLPIVGIAWYQGCSNAGDGEGHVAKLDALVNGWRSFWGAETPFYIIQLSTWKDKTNDPAGGDGFARIRNGQRLAAEKIPHSGLVVTIDIGADNNWDIHPKNKLDVGIRLSKWALRDIYGKKDLVVSGPRYAGMSCEGDAIRVRFSDCGSGLMAGDKLPETPGVAPKPSADGVLKGFAIAGSDRKWTWAQAKIDGNTVILSAPGVKNPVAVRYAHRMNPQGACNLYNREGLPASPFRTDAW